MYKLPSASVPNEAISLWINKIKCFLSYAVSLKPHRIKTDFKNDHFHFTAKMNLFRATCRQQ